MCACKPFNLLADRQTNAHTHRGTLSSQYSVVLPAAGVQYCNERVCLFMCVSVCRQVYLRKYTPDLHQINYLCILSVAVDLFFVGRRWDTLCRPTSLFLVLPAEWMDDAVFARDGQYVHMSILVVPVAASDVIASSCAG